MHILPAAFLLSLALHCTSAHWLDAVASRTNALRTTWKAAVSPRFANSSRHEIIAMMGVPMDAHERSLLSLPQSASASLAVPAAFNVYEQWPQCFAYIADQGEATLVQQPGVQYRHKYFAGQCGSCWAFGTGGSLADRLCIASNASKGPLPPPNPQPPL